MSDLPRRLHVACLVLRGVPVASGLSLTSTDDGRWIINGPARYTAAVSRHVRTDPLCVEFHTPRTRLQRLLFERSRGLPCQPCAMQAAKTARGGVW